MNKGYKEKPFKKYICPKCRYVTSSRMGAPQCYAIDKNSKSGRCDTRMVEEK